MLYATARPRTAAASTMSPRRSSRLTLPYGIIPSKTASPPVETPAIRSSAGGEPALQRCRVAHTEGRDIGPSRREPELAGRKRLRSELAPARTEVSVSANAPPIGTGDMPPEGPCSVIHRCGDTRGHHNDERVISDTHRQCQPIGSQAAGSAVNVAVPRASGPGVGFACSRNSECGPMRILPWSVASVCSATSSTRPAAQFRPDWMCAVSDVWLTPYSQSSRLLSVFTFTAVR